MYYRNTRQSKNINFIWWYPDKHSQQQQIDIVFSRRCIQEHSEFCVIIFLFFEDYINFSLWFCWLRQQTVVYLGQPQNTFFIPVLLTGTQMNFVSHLLFISVFEVDITFWVRLTNSFLKNKFGSRIIFCNHGHNILRLFDGSANFPLTTSETKHGYQ